MDQNKRQAIALMKYSAIVPLISGTQGDYESLRAYYRDASAKGVTAPDGQIRHYSPGTIQKWHLAYKNGGEYTGIIRTPFLYYTDSVTVLSGFSSGIIRTAF